MTTLEELRVKISVDTNELTHSLLTLKKEVQKFFEGAAESLDSDFANKPKTSPFKSILNLTNEENLHEVITSKVFSGEGLNDLEKQILQGIDGIKGVLEDHLQKIIQAERKRLEGEGLQGEEIEDRLDAILSPGQQIIDDLFDDFSDTLDEAVQDLSRKVADAFVDMALKGEFSIKTLGDIFLRTFLDIIAKELIQKPLEELLGGLIDAGTNALTHSASGGEIAAGVPTFINEQGQEVFIPHAPGKILTADQTRHMFGSGKGVVVTQNLSFDTAIKNDMIGTILQASPLLVEQTKIAVIESLQGRRI